MSDLIDNIIIRFDSAALNAGRDRTIHIQSQDYIRTRLPSTKLFLVSPYSNLKRRSEDEEEKASTILAIVTALSVLAGCGGNSAPDNQRLKRKSCPRREQERTGIHLDYGQPPYPEVPSDMIEKSLEEKTGTKLDIQWVPDGTYDEKVNASFATGTRRR